MKNMKKIISILLLIVMLLTTLPITTISAAVEPQEATIDLSNYDTAEEYVIMNTADWEIIATSNKNFMGITIKLGADIDFEGATATPLFNSTPFYGIFDGQGHTIKNAVVSDSDDTALIAPQFGGGKITNVNFSNIIISTTAGNVGLIAGRNSAWLDIEISRINATNITVNNSGTGDTGLLIGQDINNGYTEIITKINLHGIVNVSNEGNVGGVVGSAQIGGTTQWSKIAAYVDITSDQAIPATTLGGFAGLYQVSSGKKVEISDIVLLGSILDETITNSLYAGFVGKFAGTAGQDISKNAAGEVLLKNILLGMDLTNMCGNALIFAGVHNGNLDYENIASIYESNNGIWSSTTQRWTGMSFNRSSFFNGVEAPWASADPIKDSVALITLESIPNRITLDANYFIDSVFVDGAPIIVPGNGTLINAPGTYTIFNSGATAQYGYDHYQNINPAPDTIDNNGYDLYGALASATTQRFRLGQSFTMGFTASEYAILNIMAWDVDEDERNCGRGYEYDYIYLMDETSGTPVRLDGHMSGQDDTWNNSTFQVPSELLQAGHTYHFELEMTCTGNHNCGYYAVTVRTVSLLINGGVSPWEADLFASISADGTVSTILSVGAPTQGNYTLEYKAVFVGDGSQRGGISYPVNIPTTTTTFEHSFVLEYGASRGVYVITVFIKDAQGNVVTTRVDTAGWNYSAVSYNANGGSQNLPTDINIYSSGDTVDVLFNYVPSRAGYEFLGWATDRGAVVPEFTLDGVNSFTIGSSDVTLYAVWRENTPVNSGVITVESDNDVYVMNADTGYFQTVEFYYVASGFTPIEAMAITPIFDDSVFEFVSAEWIQIADIQNVENGTLRSVAAWSNATDINGNVYKITLRTKATTSATEIGAEVLIQDANGLSDVQVISKTVAIVGCTHHYEIHRFDGVYHELTCTVCGFVCYEMHMPSTEWYCDDVNHWHICTVCGEIVDLHEHVYDDASDSVCNDCGYSRVMRGDFDGDGDVDPDDAIYLLSAYFFVQAYPLNQNPDVDGNGVFDPDDPIYLLSHYFFQSDYPLH